MDDDANENPDTGSSGEPSSRLAVPLLAIVLAVGLSFGLVTNSNDLAREMDGSWELVGINGWSVSLDRAHFRGF